MKRHAALILSVLMMLSGVGCGNDKSVKAPDEPTTGEITEQVVTESPQPVIPEVGSLLNGLPLERDMITRRPIAVMLDNHIGARPQAGLSEADIVIEAFAEGQITRYMAVFQSADPESIGSVRSARPYFVDMALAYDAYYVHAGGSPQALKELVQKGVADIDSLHEGKVTFWRKSHKRAPHNLYTSPSAVRNAAAARKYRTEWKGIPQNFAYEGNPESGTVFRQVNLRYKEPDKGDSTGYTAAFTVSGDDVRMMRSVNGKIHADETTQTPLYAENLIIQLASHRTLDSQGRLDIDLIGSGTGFYCSAGEYWPITWEKKSADAQTTYALSDGTPLRMKPGKLWIEIFPTKKTLEFQ